MKNLVHIIQQKNDEHVIFAKVTTLNHRQVPIVFILFVISDDNNPNYFSYLLNHR